ncbi:hypothetical protein [Lapidilactobacillus bayanensis]|uniref:hypothetical protein n=1 Tax=Lapidilactobacillus bayanensis TaxID=2485998 RepID=UPI000F7B20B7|nr:hypothetical protein [Lapidilactobacillus bayanensis]
MTKYVSTTDLTTVIKPQDAVWQAADSVTTPLAVDLVPLIFNQEIAPLTILQQLYAKFLPDLDHAQIATAIETATQTSFKEKQLSKFVTPDYTEVADQQSTFNFSELFGGPTMSSADIATLAITQLAKPTQTLVATDPETIISLGHTLLDSQKLIGIYNQRHLPAILQTELAELQVQDNVALFLSKQPAADVKTLLTRHADYQLIDQSVLLTQIPQIAAIANLIAQANQAQVNLVIPGTKLNTVLAAVYAQQLGMPVAKINIAVAEDSDLAAFLKGQSTKLAPDLRANLLRLAVLSQPDVLNNPAEMIAALTHNAALNFVFVETSAVYAKIRFLQTKLDYTAGFETALTALAVPLDHAETVETVVLALVDPFVTPEVILRGLTGRVDGKVGFDAVQILRQIVGAKPARLITHLKGIKPVTVPEFTTAVLD